MGSMPDLARCTDHAPGEAVGCIIHTEGRCRWCETPRCHRHVAEHEERCPKGPEMDRVEAVALARGIEHGPGCPFGDLAVSISDRGPYCAHCGASPKGPGGTG